MPPLPCITCPSESPVRSTAYFDSASMESSGPIVNTAGRENCSFSLVMAWSDMLKSKGVIESLVTFWKGLTCTHSFIRSHHAGCVIATGFTKAFFAILTLSIPTPVMARYEFGSETWYQSIMAVDIVLLLCWRRRLIEVMMRRMK